MSKRRLIWVGVIAAALVGAVGAYWALVQNSEEKALNASKGEYTDEELAAARKKLPIKQLAPAPASVPVKPLDLSPNNPIRFAVGSLGLADDEQNGRVGALIVADLNGAQGLDLVERQSLQQVLHELDLSLSGLVRAKDAVRVGKFLKADWFLLGTPATIKGTNSVVVRVVDARTGILCDAGIFAIDANVQQLATEIAAFVRQTRQNAANNKVAEFLAIGGLQDLGVNNREAGFPAQLRGYLTAAYQGKAITVLERDSVEALLHEVYLDLGGLTEDSGASGSTMQSAYWLVSGSYQSYETTNIQLEVVLDVERIFATTKHVELRGLPGDQFCEQIKQAIDTIISQGGGRVLPIRRNEIAVQLSIGEKICGQYFDLAWTEQSEGKYIDGYTGIPVEGAAKRKRNLEEAIKAFETVLLLDHDNHEAKIYLAACFRSPLINRVDEARQYYRQIIDAEDRDRWTDRAQEALEGSFQFRWNPIERVQWFKSASEATTPPRAHEYYVKQAKKAQEILVAVQAEHSESPSPDSRDLVERRMFEGIRAFINSLHTKNPSWGSDFGVRAFVKSFGTNQEAAARRLFDLLPEVKKQSPEIVPYYLASIVHYESDSNAPVVTKFKDEIERLQQHPDRLLGPPLFWNHIGIEDIRLWGFNHQRYDLVAALMELAGQTAVSHRSGRDELEFNEDKLTLAYAYEGLEQWQKALDIFQSFTNGSFVMERRGPWGRGETTVLTVREAEFCAGKLGRSIPRDPREFEMGNDCFCLHPGPAAIGFGDDAIWVGITGQLVKLGFDLKTNLVVSLPADVDANVSCVYVGDGVVWVGTDGGGLLEYDKSTGQFRHFTVKDGMLMNTISCFDIDGSSLWIGYGRSGYQFWGSSRGTEEGGVGRVNLSTHKFESFTRSLQSLNTPGGEFTTQAPRHPIIALRHGSENDVWCVSDGHQLRHFQQREDKWSAADRQIAFSSLAIDSKQLYVGTYRSEDSEPYQFLGVSTFDPKTSKWGNVSAIDGLPRGQVSALELNHGKLWVGGKSYIALVDIERDKVLKFTRIPTQVVNQIYIGGGYMWAVYESHLHRVALGNVQ